MTFSSYINTHPNPDSNASVYTTYGTNVVGSTNIGVFIKCLFKTRKLASHSSVQSKFTFFHVNRVISLAIQENPSTNF